MDYLIFNLEKNKGKSNLKENLLYKIYVYDLRLNSPVFIGSHSNEKKYITSNLKSVSFKNDILIIETENSHYTFRKEE